MALIKCPECGRSGVSDKSNACPGCGINIAEALKKFCPKCGSSNKRITSHRDRFPDGSNYNTVQGNCNKCGEWWTISCTEY